VRAKKWGLSALQGFYEGEEGGGDQDDFDVGIEGAKGVTVEIDLEGCNTGL